MGIYRTMLGLTLRRPSLLPAVLGLAWAGRRRGWWRRPPFLPLPPWSYLAWRMETAYGERDHEPPAEELERYLRWTRRMRRTSRARRP